MHRCRHWFWLGVQFLPWHHRLLPHLEWLDKERGHGKIRQHRQEYGADEVGILKAEDDGKTRWKPCGDVGYIITGIKMPKKWSGWYDHLANNPTPEQIKDGFEEVKPMVFAGIFPVNTDDFEELRDCMDKLQLNDASLTFELETSQGIGLWFPLRLPRDAAHGIIQERLEGSLTKRWSPRYQNVSFCYTKGEKWLWITRQKFPTRAYGTYWRTFYQSTDHYQTGIHRQHQRPLPWQAGILMNQSYLTQTGWNWYLKCRWRRSYSTSTINWNHRPAAMLRSIITR